MQEFRSLWVHPINVKTSTVQTVQPPTSEPTEQPPLNSKTIFIWVQIYIILYCMAL